MARINVSPVREVKKTHEGAVAYQHLTLVQELRRTLLACMLWEDTFYESGVDIARRIENLVEDIDDPRNGKQKGIPADVPTGRILASLAVEARTRYNLRHAPLWLIRAMAKGSPGTRKYVANSLEQTIQRADELAEFVALYWKDGKQPLSAQVKKGLAGAFTKFDAYQLAKYDREGAVKLRDVLFLSHAKPRNEEQAAMWKQLVDGTLPIPDTWEVALSTGQDKKETWERLIQDNKLGGLAFLRNLRNMKEVGVDETVIAEGLARMKTDRILPYRFIAAARAVPMWEDKIEPVMLRSLDGHEKLSGNTVLLVDVSSSMEARISDKSDLTRIDAASALAILMREVCENVEIYSFSDYLKGIPPRHGFALRDAIVESQPHAWTALGAAVSYIDTHSKYDRLIVFTDEQSQDPVPDPENGRGYMINVASYQHGVGYGKWLHIDGFSEATLDYIIELEKSKLDVTEE